MIGMTFVEFGVLVIAGLISAVVIHYAVGYRFLQGIDGLLAKWGVGWLGAWVGSPVLGHWFEPLKVGNVYLLPALIGAFAGSFMVTASYKAAAMIHGTQEVAAPKAGMPRAA